MYSQRPAALEESLLLDQCLRTDCWIRNRPHRTYTHTHAHTLVPAMRLTHPSDLLPHSPLLCFSGRFETVNKCVILETFDPRASTSATAFLPHGPSARL